MKRTDPAQPGQRGAGAGGPRHEARARAERIRIALRKEYPDTPCPLRHRNAYELLVATILSAQCTDARVNAVTPALFRRYPHPAALAAAVPEELQQSIRPTGFFRNKTRNLIACARTLDGVHHGSVPGSLEDLAALPGVGRKTANVMLAHWFGEPAVVVDTHFRRVATRLGLTTAAHPDLIEAEIRRLVPPEHQTELSGVVNYHGRRCCSARRPQCERCAVAALCPYYARLASLASC